VTDFIHQGALTHLSHAETRLASVLARPRAIAVACVLALTATGWLALGLFASNADLWDALCRAVVPGEWGGFALVLAMWVAMVLAMMLPTAGPMILTYAEIADTAAHKGEPVVSPFVLAAGYVAVWLGFAAFATVLQIALTRAGLLDSDKAGSVVAGMIFLIAGGYQFSMLKHACLSKCQRPFPFFFANWTEEVRGVFKLGLRQGVYCLGCCWAMMLVMFAVGVMNIVWMAALGILMTIEKITSTPRFSRVVGVASVAVGLTLIASSFAWMGFGV
jgi:predicted metal-binding membrane protein